MSKATTKLMEVRHGLRQGKKLSEIWQEFSPLWQELGWQQSQLRLWLAVLAGVTVNTSESKNPSYQMVNEQQNEDDLANTIFQLISEAGRPLPIAQLKSQLSASLATTEPMIKAAVKGHQKLTIMGPVVKIK